MRRQILFPSLVVLFLLFGFSSCALLGSLGNQVYRCVPMTQMDHSRALTLIKSRSFESDRLATAKQQTRCMTTQQIHQITATLTFESSRLEYAKFAYPSCADPANYGQINSLLTFESSKRELGQMTGVN